jgi:hypothetical protein
LFRLKERLLAVPFESVVFIRLYRSKDRKCQNSNNGSYKSILIPRNRLRV